MFIRTSACAVIALAAGVAHAGITPPPAFFSFASDQADTSWSFTGNGATITDAMSAQDPIKLVIDDANGMCPSIKIQAEFFAEFSLSNYQATQIAPTTYLHSYIAEGSFGFKDPGTGADWLVAQFDDSVFTSPGSATRWSSTGAALGSDDFAGVRYQATAAFIDAINAALDGTGKTAIDYNIFEGFSVDPDDFGFDMTVLNSGPNGVSINPDTGLPTKTWVSEGSYSGSATFVPTPGAAALAGLGMLAVARRRRSN